MHIYPGFQNINSRAGVAFRAMKADLRRSLTPTNRSKGSLVVLSDKDRARLVEVRTAIQDGSPLYTKDDLDKQGTATIGTSRHERVVREDTDAQVMEKVAHWRSGVATSVPRNRGYQVQEKPQVSIEHSLGIPDIRSEVFAPQYREIKTPEGIKRIHFVYCSWCGRQVDEAVATRSKDSTRIACQNHALKIRNVRFPESVG